MCISSVKSVLIAGVATLTLVSCQDSADNNVLDSGSGITANTVIYPADRKYSDNHEWVRLESNGIATVGITPYAVDNFDTDPIDGVDTIATVATIVYQDPEPMGSDASDDKRKKKTPKEILEDLRKKAQKKVNYAIGGSPNTRNSLLDGDISHVNSDPLGTGWLFTLDSIDLNDYDSLMTAAEYEIYIGNQ